jgi:hypothetical protein
MTLEAAKGLQEPVIAAIREMSPEAGNVVVYEDRLVNLTKGR